MFLKIGNVCGDFVTVDVDITYSTQMQLTRILVKLDGRVLPKPLQVVVGSSTFSLQL